MALRENRTVELPPAKIGQRVTIENLSAEPLTVTQTISCKIRIGRPRIEVAHKTLAATKPWAALGMSERTWFRRQAEKRVK